MSALFYRILIAKINIYFFIRFTASFVVTTSLAIIHVLTASTLAISELQRLIEVSCILTQNLEIHHSVFNIRMS